MSDLQNETEDADTFQRCPHDKQNPYVMISRDLIRDQNISPNCRWLVIYLLSNQDGWKVRVPYIISHVEGHIGRDKVYKVIDEAIEAGYVRRVEFLDKGRKKFKYFVSETPKFKKYLLYPEIQYTEIQYTENQDTKEVTTSSIEEKKEQYKEAPISSPPSADASNLYSFFLGKIKERFPQFKQPNETKWKEHFDRMLRIDKRSVEEITKLIEWAAEDSWWKKACLSPEKLRAKYDDMSIAMLGDAENQLIQSNRAYAMEAKRSYPEQLKDLTFDKNYVMHRSAGKEISFKMQRDAFIEAFNITFGGS